MGNVKQISFQELKDLRNATLGKRLKWVIKKLEMKGKEFAQRCGLSYRTLTDYLNDKRTPGANNLRPIAETFNINLHWLITGEGYPFVEQVKEPVKEVSEPEREKRVVVSDEERGRMEDLQEEIDQVRGERREGGEGLKEEFKHIARCVEVVSGLPEEERYVKLFEMVGEKYGIKFLFHPDFGRTEKGKPGRKLETVRDIIEAYYEIDDFIRQAKEKIMGG